jgi:cytidylate kinase
MTEAVVIAIDGPSGAGKGAVTQHLAQRTGFQVLDSGALYRLTGFAARLDGLELSDALGVAAVARALDVHFIPTESGNEPFEVMLRGAAVTDSIRTDQAGVDASTVAALPMVRAALGDRQQAFRQAPGLIADGRDMGTVVFKDALVKIFLTASAEIRAERRYNQLKNKGMNVSLANLRESIQVRDERDSNRAVAPLKPAEDAVVIDSSGMPLEAVHDAIWAVVSKVAN